MISPATKEIVKGCIKGDANCQEQLYNMLSPRLYGVCLRYAKEYNQAQDYLQEAFIRIFNKLHTFKYEGSLEGWARRVTVNIILRDFEKKQVLRQAVDINENEYLATYSEKSTSSLQYEELLSFIQQLPEGKKLVFNLYVIEGYSHKEIAEKLHISEGTSKSQLSRAKEILKKLHQEYNQEYV